MLAAELTALSKEEASIGFAGASVEDLLTHIEDFRRAGALAQGAVDSLRSAESRVLVALANACPEG